ncbi:Serpin 85F [Carabus blaptoides fortunei]
MCTSKWLFAILFVTCIARSDSHTQAWHADERTPSELMVDVINTLGLNILKLHNQNNENNIALSPYGVASILTALLEGVRGRAALEIQQCGGFPADKDVVRVGLRDIHRLLRSYFIPQEGFLSGLSLSSEKVTLKPEYQSILRFYGFDMTSFNTPIYPDLGTTTPINNITTTSTDTTTDNAVTTETTTEMNTNTTTLKPTTQIDETTTITQDTTTEGTTMSTTTMISYITTTEQITTDGTQSETRPVTVTEVTDTTFVTTTTLPDITTASTVTTTITTTNIPDTTTVNAETTTGTIETTTGRPETTTGSTDTTTGPTDTTTATIEVTTENTETTTRARETTTLRIRRVGRSVVDYFLARYYDDRNHDSYTPSRSDNKYSFLVGGKFQETHIHFMTYDVVLPFTYIHNLNALALRFPLDSPKYYLLLILPIDDQGIDKLVCDIGKSASLKQIVSYMRPTYVRAVIPSFMLRGFVILTSSLQKLGIREIFEPRRSDFSSMTDDKDIYVTNIEQAITVMIKNYMDPTMLGKNGNLYQYGPVEFKATHPFLYFVMDSEIDVALVAGKIVNPINSRIQ